MKQNTLVISPAQLEDDVGGRSRHRFHFNDIVFEWIQQVSVSTFHNILNCSNNG